MHTRARTHTPHIHRRTHTRTHARTHAHPTLKPRLLHPTRINASSMIGYRHIVLRVNPTKADVNGEVNESFIGAQRDCQLSCIIAAQTPYFISRSAPVITCRSLTQHTPTCVRFSCVYGTVRLVDQQSSLAPPGPVPVPPVLPEMSPVVTIPV